MRSPKNAFTLVELLVVLAIIAIITSLVIPAVTSSFKKANIAKSAGNLKNLSTGSMTWQAENGMVLPYLFADASNPASSKPWWAQYWHVQLLPYIGQKEITSAGDLNKYVGKRPPGPLADPLSKQNVPSGAAHFRLSDYGRNPAVAQYPGTPASPQWDPALIRYKVISAAINRPSQIFMLMPSYDLLPDVYVTGGNTLARDVTRYGPIKSSTPIPVAFFDGHVELLPRSDIEGPANQVKWYGNFPD